MRIYRILITYTCVPAIEGEEVISSTWTAKNGRAAIAKAIEVLPDIVTDVISVVCIEE